MTTLPEPPTAATAPADLLGDLAEPTVPALVELLARRYGDEEAVVGPEGRLRFRDLAHRAGCMAAFYAAAGLRPGDRVAVLLPNGCRWLVAALGALRAGLVVVPTNTWYRAPELAHVLHTAQIRLVVTDERVFGRDVPAELGAAGHPQRYARARRGLPRVRHLVGRGGTPRAGAGDGRRAPADLPRGRPRPRPVHEREHRPAQAGATAPRTAPAQRP